VVDLADALTVAGGVFEAAGILLTVRELVRVEDRAFPERRNRPLRAWRWMQRRLGFTRPVEAEFRGDADSGTMSESAAVRREYPPADPDDLRARLDRLEQLVDARDDEHRAATEEVRRRGEELARGLDQRLGQLEGRIAGERANERGALRDSLALQKAYALLFAFGAVLSTVGGVIGSS
jgi:hypothetical protein